MKKKIALFLFITLLIAGGLSSCSVSVKSGQSLPPGQVKKITGSQSAAPYAPGHNK